MWVIHTGFTCAMYGHHWVGCPDILVFTGHSLHVLRVSEQGEVLAIFRQILQGFSTLRIKHIARYTSIVQYGKYHSRPHYKVCQNPFNSWICSLNGYNRCLPYELIFTDFLLICWFFTPSELAYGPHWNTSITNL